MFLSSDAPLAATHGERGIKPLVVSRLFAGTVFHAL